MSVLMWCDGEDYNDCSDISSVGFQSSLGSRGYQPTTTATSTTGGQQENAETLKSLQKHYIHAITSLNPHQSTSLVSSN